MPPTPARPAEASAPELVLILDTETTALEPEDGHVIEVGAILFSVPERGVVAQLSFLLPCVENPAQGVNGISPGLTHRAPREDVLRAALYELGKRADLYLAHNADFDRRWFERRLAGCLPEKRWLCTMDDVVWPELEERKGGRAGVKDIALAYGVPVWAQHRALTDCIYLAQAMEREPDLEEVLVRAQAPKGLFQAMVSYQDRELAKEAGFQWDPKRKAWLRKLPLEDSSVFPFEIKYLQDA